jgi:hypothetical protein
MFQVVAIGMLAVMTTILFGGLALPSFHRFVPHPDNPKECVHCGRRADVHQPR